MSLQTEGGNVEQMLKQWVTLRPWFETKNQFETEVPKHKVTLKFWFQTGLTVKTEVQNENLVSNQTIVMYLDSCL